MPQGDPFGYFVVPEEQADQDPFAAFAAMDAPQEAEPTPFVGPMDPRRTDSGYLKLQESGYPAEFDDPSYRPQDIIPLMNMGGLPVGRILTATGGALERGARAVIHSVPGRWGLAGSLASGNPKAMAVAAAPYLVQGAGAAIRKTGQAIGRLTAPAAKAASKAAPAAVKTGPAVKPKLSAQELASAMRKQYGSERAGRMLYGKALPGAERKEAIKRLAPGASQLPGQAQQAIKQGIQQGTPEEAWAYAMRAPNQMAREFLIKMMRGGR